MNAALRGDDVKREDVGPGGARMRGEVT
jgi:hypothetical protein